MPSPPRMAAVVSSLESRIRDRGAGLLARYPVEGYLRAAEEGRGAFHPAHARALALHAAVLGAAGARTASLYQRLALARLLERRARQGEGPRFLPESVRRRLRENEERIGAALETLPDSYFTPAHVPFWEDLGLLTGRLIPVSDAWCVEVSRLRRKHFVAGGAKEITRFALFLLTRVRGVHPFYVIHTLKRYTRGFSPCAREECYRAIAELLRADSRVRGMYACGWLYDPALARISPELSFLGEVPRGNGAAVFRIGPSDFALRNALAWSPGRRALWEQGRYIPADYGLIWPRRELMAWAGRRL